MTKLVRIAVDGPGGAGKSTVAKAVSAKLSIDYVDTGAMYRAIAYKMNREGILPEDEKGLEEVLDRTEIGFSDGRIYLDGEDVEGVIRTSEVSKLASEYSRIGTVRRKLGDIQSKMAKKQSLVMDGRDIGTHIIPDAEYKFFVTAKAEERAKRRYNEDLEKNGNADYNKIFREIKERDWNDTHREINPLRKAEDAIEVDTTDMSIDEVVSFICNRIDMKNE